MTAASYALGVLRINVEVEEQKRAKNGDGA